MDGFAGWLKQVIAVVLLASLVDLLLPNRTMQKYVRLVAGLFILLTVATPVLHWLKGDFGTKLAEGLVSVERDSYSAPEQLAQIEQDGARIRDKQTDRAAQLVTVRLSQEIRQAVEKSEKKAVSRVDIKTARDTDGTLAVASVTIVLGVDGSSAISQGNDADEMNNAKPIADIKPITPVTIDVTAGSGPAEDSGPAAALPALAPDSSEQQRIITLVSTRFGIDIDSVMVKQEVPDHPGAPAN
jgi:stage III sporulation protein AF